MDYGKKLFFLIVMACFPLTALGQNNQISISYSNTAGNTNTQSLTVGYRFEKGLEGKRFYSNGSYFYKKDDGKETANKLVVDNRFELDITNRLLFFVKNFIHRDTFSGYNLRLGVGPGVGYQLLKKDNENLKLFFGADFTYNNYVDQGTENYVAGDVGLEYNRQLLENLFFTQKVSYLMSLKNSKDYFVHSETCFKVPITEKMALGVSYKINYHNLLPDGAKYHTDKMFSTSLIYSF
ncbi:protein of unknown function DUF481 [Desulfurobacterium thermolithotrophum DSM 11699]|uniref:Salt-induced outer membrane protein n=1 Tax=Desulfurobacterium thermolithotrophum (strain DSM 11699 / BSA) TaxID=868864 RepID=F0S0K7_DESTD|nr:DUF481 domain-containing protein [Desulfurobacterium thermolithotrophum]ADY72735.1 protein of unknown function DUF481 [Desulfurobacterium thermolithotrophum DSM 11699]